MAYNVFISHSFDHGELYDSLVTRLNRSKFNWIDCSVPRQRRYGSDGVALSDEEMKAKLSDSIDRCDVVVAIAKPIASIRPWLRWELEYAKLNDKPIIAVWRRQVDLRISRFVMVHADTFVDTWNIKSIARKIEEVVKQSQRLRKQSEHAKNRLVPTNEIYADDTEIVPLTGSSAEELAPVEELALSDGEIVHSPEQFPRDVIGVPSATEGNPESFPIPLHSVLPKVEQTDIPAAESPRDVISTERLETRNLAASEFRRHWWWPFRRARTERTG